MYEVKYAWRAIYALSQHNKNLQNVEVKLVV